MKLSAEQWGHAQRAWEQDAREGYTWLVKELSLPVSVPAVRKTAARQGWLKVARGEVPRRRGVEVIDAPSTQVSLPDTEKPVSGRNPSGETRDGPVLTPKQEQFIAAYLASGNASEAYRTVYDCADASDATIQREASRLLGHPKIAPRLADARNKAADVAGVTLAGHLGDLLALREEARQAGQFSAAISAEVCRAKIAGLEPARPQPVIALVDKQAMDEVYQRALSHAAQVQERMTGRAERLGLTIEHALDDGE